MNKKVLLITEWAPPKIGGPQNLYNIFSRLPAASYVVLTSIVNFVSRGQLLGSCLPGAYYFYDQLDRMPATCSAVRPHRPFPLWKKIPWGCARVVRLGWRFCSSFRLGWKLIRQHRIDVMVAISGYGFGLSLTYALSRVTGVPYILYFFDLYRENNLPFLWRYLARMLEPTLFRHAVKIIVTNEGTREYYQRAYGSHMPLAVIHNATDRSTYDRARQPYAPQPPYTVLFTGNIYWAQERSIRNLIRAVIGITDLDIRLHLYVPNPPPELVQEYHGHPKIHFIAATPSAMAAIQCRADILFLPLAWDTPSPQIIATASPGKLTDYLIAGRPILIHAPPYAYVTRYAMERRFAHVVSEENLEFLKTGIKKILTDRKYASMLIRNAQGTFASNHVADVNAKKFQAILNSV